MLSIAVLGSGRMGRQILQVIGDADDCQVAAVWARTGGTSIHRKTSADLESVLIDADVAIDFTLPDATREVLRASVASRTPLVCGVSGLDDELLAALIGASSEIPLLYDRNMSVGVALLTRLVEIAGLALSSDFACEIAETHHIHKLDAPSGTALLLGEAVAASRGQNFTDVYRYDPSGRSPASSDAINFVVTRQDEVPGDHRVEFSTPFETVAVSHSVADRRVFAEGAVSAARWLAGQPPGRYRIADSLSAAGAAAASD